MTSDYKCSDAAVSGHDTAVLAFHLAEPHRLTDIFGVNVANEALKELGDSLDPLIGRLLAQHQLLQHSRPDASDRRVPRRDTSGSL